MVQVRVFWPDGSSELKSHTEIRGLHKTINGDMERPSCVVCDVDLSMLSPQDCASVTHDLVKCGAYVRPMPVSDVSSLNGKSVSETLNRAHTQEVVSKSRSNYLYALASHHARVANIAVEMQKLTRPETWNSETMELMAEIIESSFIEAFGTEIKHNPFPQRAGITEYKQHVVLRHLIEKAICNDPFVNSFYHTIIQIKNYSNSNAASGIDILTLCISELHGLAIVAKHVMGQMSDAGKIIHWRCPNDTNGDRDCHRCHRGQCPLKNTVPHVPSVGLEKLSNGGNFSHSQSLISEDMISRCLMNEQEQKHFIAASNLVTIVEHGVKIEYYRHPEGSILISSISPHVDV